MQVCSTWQAVSRSDPHWHRLTRVIWGRNHLMRDTWREEYNYLHQRFRIFVHDGRAVQETLHFDPSHSRTRQMGWLAASLMAPSASSTSPPASMSAPSTPRKETVLAASLAPCPALSSPIPGSFSPRWTETPTWRS
ncbi:hypothetical protein PTKIN_Ptkin01aG0387800 [Pterospermum kingtungense]